MRYNIEKEIDLIINLQDFLSVHEAYGHCLTEHVTDLDGLKNKLYNMKKPVNLDEIVMATRFFSRQQALTAIQRALKEHLPEIIEWRRKLEEPIFTFEHYDSGVTGEGICKTASYNNLLPVHGTRIVLAAGDSIGRAFYIKTAYPVCIFIDIDDIYDAIDEYQNSKNK